MVTRTLNMQGSIIVVIISVLTITIIKGESINNPKVKLPLGTLEGKFLTSRNGHSYEGYLGIQYGQVSERFGISKPIASKWVGLKEATKFGPHCAQPIILTAEPITVGSEDCLFLNIYTRQAVGNRKRPVLFYIHGGGFTVGTGTLFGGDYLVDEDIILVTINFRLGIFGFLNTEDGSGSASGNMGLKDQLLALKWVQKNIEYFGGDKNKITISGASAGGASATYFLFSQVAKGVVCRPNGSFPANIRSSKSK